MKVEEDEEMRDGMEVVRDASLSNLSGIPTGLGDLTPHQSLHSVSAISLLSEGDSLQKSYVSFLIHYQLDHNITDESKHLQ